MCAEMGAGRSAQRNSILLGGNGRSRRQINDKICFIRVDVVVIWGKMAEQWISWVELVLAILEERGLFVAAHEEVLYRKEMQWCGNLYSGDRMDHDPDRVQGLVEMRLPENAGKLQHFLHAVN